MEVRTLLLTLIVSTAAWAQEVEPPPETAPAGPATIPVRDPEEPEPENSEPTMLESVVVTATKREEPAREIAGSLFVLGGEALENMGAREQEDFLEQAVGVSLFKGEPNQNRVGIRGIAEDSGTAQSTGILIGDVPFSDPFVADQSPDLSPFDLETLEVLKGPQGTLFGASGLGGSLRYVLRPAQLDTWETRGFVAYDGVAQGEREPSYGLAVNAPLLRDDLALRVVGTYRKRPGVIDETGREEPDVDRSDQLGYRGLLRYATGRWDAQFMHLAQETAIDDLGFVDNLEGRLDRDSTPTPSPTTSNFSLDTLTLSHEFDWAHIVSATGHMSKLFDASGDTSRLVPGTRVLALATLGGYTQEVRLVSPSDADGPWRWLLGVFVMRYENFRRVDLLGDTLGPTGTPVPGVPAIPGTVGVTGDDTGLIARYDLDAAARERALFGEVTRALGDRWDVTLGLRAYRTDSDGIATSSGPLNLALTGQQESHNDAGISERGLNPKIAVRFRPGEEFLAYGLVSRGFRFGGVSLIGDTPTDDVPETYKSDHIWLHEAGLRSAWFQSRLVADASVYRIDWKDPQITQLTDSGLLLYTDNAGGARVRGADLTLRYVPPIDGLTLSATGAYTDARTTEEFTAASGAQIPVGARWPFTPDRQLATTASYVNYLGRWMLSGTTVYTFAGKGVANIENTVPVFDYATLDVRIQLGASGLPAVPTLTLSGTNVLDERGVASRTDSGDIRTIYYVRPRALSLQLELRF